MVERTHIPSSPACGEWETLLADALDGLLLPEDEAKFTAHMAQCLACAAMFEEARRGREWLEFLSPEPEVPADLLHKLLTQTGPGASPTQGLAAAGAGGHSLGLGAIPHWQRPGFMAQLRHLAEPRLIMTAAMAFFSIALTLNLAGVRLSNLRLSELRPTALRAMMERRLTTASTPIIRYYDHLRFVYEVESRMRELRRATQGDGQGTDYENQQTPTNPQPAAPGESKKNPEHKDGGSLAAPPQQSNGPAMDVPSDLLESSLRVQGWSSPLVAKGLQGIRSAHSGGSTAAREERSEVWTASITVA